MTLLATFKHISSKNADYGAAEAYLTFEHDEFTMKPTLDENGRLIPREDYRISSLNCGGEDFAVACMRANLRHEKNQKREDVKSHHYIISFDPRDGTDNGLTTDRAQELGEQFCKAHFHDFALEIFHSGVGAAVLAALQRVGWSVHVGQKRDFVNPQGVDDDMHMDIPAVVMPVRVGAD